METEQVKFWKGNFGKEYTDRNSFLSFEEWDQNYVSKYGISRTKMFEDFIFDLDRSIKILEVGCNTGMQLRCLQKMGFENLYGLELQTYVVQKAKEFTVGINIIEGSGFDIPFKDGFFDMVMVNGVMIHIAPEDLLTFISEVYRCKSNYILGIEYFEENYKEINYRGHQGYLWKANFEKLYLENFKDLGIVKSIKYPYVTKVNEGNQDLMFLIKK